MTKIVHNQVVQILAGQARDTDFVFRIGWDEPGEPCGDALMQKGNIRRHEFFVAAGTVEDAFAKAKDYQPKAFHLRHETLATVAVLREAIGCRSES